MPVFSNNIAIELAELQKLCGADFVNRLKAITQMSVFRLVQGESFIYAIGGERSDDYSNLLKAAKKATEHGYTVYILPNPRNIRTADFIFERKGVFKLFDLKTISGKSSIGNRLQESIGQSNRVLLNLTGDYNLRHLATDVRHYFENSPSSLEVLIFKGNKKISITRNIAESSGFLKMVLKAFR